MTNYSAFISYSHSDEAAARWLHRGIETFTMPRGLVGQDSEFGPVPKKLPAVFRDRDELVASSDLGERLRAALAASRYQIVLCSPKAAASRWVNEEILTFKRLHGEAYCLAVILSGEPYAGNEHECFPPALRFKLNSDGELSDVPAEPIAADVRPGKDGKRLALLKLIAGIAGVRLDALVRRDAARRQRRLVAIAAVSSAIALVTIGLAIYAESQRRVAVQQQQLADRSLEFLIGTFGIANPATENPRTITALTILSRASRKAGVDLADEPLVSARLLRATGEIYVNLGLFREAEHDLNAALGRLPPVSEERARALVELAAVANKRGDARAVNRAIVQADAAIPARSPQRAELKASLTELRGKAAILSGRYADSAALLAEAGKQFRSLSGDFREKANRLDADEAQSLLRVNRFAEASKLLQRAETGNRAMFGNNDVRTAMAIQNRSLALFEHGEHERAARAIDEAVAIYNRVLEKDHPLVGSALILMGRIRTSEGDYPGALSALDRARAVYVQLYGPENAAVGDADFYAAEAEAGRGAFAAALQRLDRTKAIYDKNYGPEDPDQVELLVVRAKILARAGRIDEADRACHDANALQTHLQKSAVPGAVDGCRSLSPTGTGTR